jgi:hypothetical protein
VLLEGPRAAPRATFAVVEALLDRQRDAVSALGRLLAELTTGYGGADAAPAALRAVAAQAATGAYATPSAIASAARAAIPAPRRRLRTRIGAAVGAAAVAAAILALVWGSSGRDGGDRAGAPSADTPAARVAATISLGGVPGSYAVGAGGFVWVPLADRTLVRIDPSTNRVVGSPLRFGRARKTVATSCRGARRRPARSGRSTEPGERSPVSTRAPGASPDGCEGRRRGEGGADRRAHLWAFGGLNGARLMRFDARTCDGSRRARRASSSSCWAW